MKNFFLFLFFIILPSLSFCQGIKKVLIIGIDGCRPDALAVAATPNMDNLISNGLYSPDALNTDLTISGPGWSAMLTSVWSNKHNVTDNSFSGNNYENYPHIFQYIEAFNPELETASISQWNPINDNIVLDHADFKSNAASGTDLANQAIDYISNNDPDILFLHFDDPDIIGHIFGYSPDIPQYVSIIGQVDSLIGEVLQSLMDRPNYQDEDWLILSSTDHGGLGTSHGGNSIEEQNIFTLASGPNIPTELILKDSFINTNLPENCLGDSIELQFDGIDDFVEIPSNSLFDFGSTNDFTIECRIRTDQAADVSIVGNKDWNSGYNKGFVFSFTLPSGPEWKVNIGDGTNRADLNTGGMVADNEWHTLTVSFDRDGDMIMYQDGVMIDVADISSIGDINTGEGLLLGADILGNYSYKGSIAELRVWNTVLDPEVISQYYCNEINNTHPYYNDLAGHWKMIDGEEETQVEDFSINQNSGTISGATWAYPSQTVSYDYSQTPRTTDIGITALTHLCIPIQDSWNLDGNSLISECQPVNIKEYTKGGKWNFKFFPNPAKDIVHIDINENGEKSSKLLKLVLPDGKIIFQTKLDSNSHSLDISGLTNSLYFLEIADGNFTRVKKLNVIK